jgi:hypothetical protein
MESDARKQIIFEINVSKFRGREQIKGFIRDLLYDGCTGRKTAESIFANGIARCYAETPNADVNERSTQEIRKFIEEKRKACDYGLCLIASDRRTLKHYPELAEFACDLFYPSSRNVSNALIVSPAPDADLSGFRDFVFLDTPSDFNIRCLEGKTVYVNREICGYKMFEELDTARESLLAVYSALRREVQSLVGNTAEEIANACDALGFDRWEFIFALHVFEELGLVAFGEGKLIVYRGVKAELSASNIYRKVCKLQES